MMAKPYQLAERAPIHLKFTALSQLTENMMAFSDNTFFEGAAHVYLCDQGWQRCRQVGTGFMEQMGYPTN